MSIYIFLWRPRINLFLIKRNNYLANIYNICIYSIFYKSYQRENHEKNLKSIVEEMVKEISNQSNCIVFVSDSVYRNLVDVKNIENFPNTSKYEVRYLQLSFSCTKYTYITCIVDCFAGQWTVFTTKTTNSKNFNRGKSSRLPCVCYINC